MRNVFCVFLTLLLFSCTDELIPIVEDVSSQIEPELKYAGDGRYDLLGHGCDISQDYYVGKARVLNNDSIEKYIAYAINPDMSGFRIDDITSGGTSETLLKTLYTSLKINVNGSVGTGSDKDTARAYGKGYFSRIYRDSSYITKDFSYAIVNKYIAKKGFSYTLNPSRLIPYISPEFRDALEDMHKPGGLHHIVSTFGTHVYKNIVLGGKMSIHYRCELNSNATENSRIIEAGASGVFKKVFGVDVKYSKHEQEQAINSTRYYSLRIHLIGGDSSIPITDKIYNDNDQIPSYTTHEWERSVTDTKCQLIDLPTDAFIPIWEFVSDATDKEILKNYVLNYIRENEFKDFKKRGIPLYVYYHSGNRGNHFTTTDSQIEALFSGWKRIEDSTGKVLPTQEPGTKPLYLYHNAKDFNHMTTDYPYIDRDFKDFVKQGIVGYVYTNYRLGTKPLYLYWHTGNNHYTTSINNILSSYPNQGWQNQGIIGYVIE